MTYCKGILTLMYPVFFSFRFFRHRSKPSWLHLSDMICTQHNQSIPSLFVLVIFSMSSFWSHP